MSQEVFLLPQEDGRETTEEEPRSTGRRSALLIGIRTYPRVSGRYGHPLAGCHNDVTTMRQALIARGFEPEGIRIVVDPMDSGCDCPMCLGHLPSHGSPTRDGILAEVGRLIDDAHEDDVVVIYYSGHGSEMNGSGLWTGQRFQTIVPHDSGRGETDNRDISDREVEGWIRAFGAKTPYLTLIFDCCHSGGISDLRGPETEGSGRQILGEDRPAETAFQPRVRRAFAAETRSGKRSAVVLSASAALELSSETVVDGKKQGLFTRFLTDALNENPSRDLMWSDIFPQVAESVAQENLSQHPRREGNSEIFGRGPVDTDDVYPPDVIELQKLAVVIGVDYRRAEGEPAGFTPLRTPIHDARDIARALEEQQGYEVVGLSNRSPGPLLNQKATRRQIHRLIHRLIDVRARTKRETAVLIYFAGHGMVRTDDKGRQVGYLIPWDADPDDVETWLPMKDLRDQLVDGIRDAERLQAIGVDKPLTRLTSRHLLLVLDCCFGGAMSFDFFRGSETPDRPIYYSEYKRFVEGSAWQLLTSASHNQQAMDRNPKDPHQPNSPFAQAILEGLTTDQADVGPDGRGDKLVTAGELHQYIDRRLKGMGVDVQTSSLMPLRPLKGQYFFSVPGYRPSPLPDPSLNPSDNPWMGPEPYGQESAASFFGRETATLELLDLYLKARRDRAPDSEKPIGLVVSGGPGSGKTSLIQAGLLPILQDPLKGREQLRAWISRANRRHLGISAEDLAGIRQWAQDLDIQASDSDRRLVERSRSWAREEGFARPSTASEISADQERQHLGIPSFVSGGHGEPPAWTSRVGFFELLNRPELLVQRLRLWLRRDRLMDFLTEPDERKVKRWVGYPRVVKDLPQPSEKSVRCLIWWSENPLAMSFDAARGLAKELIFLTEARDHVPHGSQETLSQETLSQETLSQETLSQETLPQELLCRDVDWHRYALKPPTREELLSAVRSPAAARVLTFEPAEQIDELAQELETIDPALPWLSTALARAVQRAWERRKDGDRRLTPEDLGAEAVASAIGRRAERVFREMTREHPEDRRLIRTLFLRAVSVGGADSARPTARGMARQELNLFDPDLHRRLHDHVLPRWLDERLLTIQGNHITLAHPELWRSWQRFDRWIRRARKLLPAGLDGLWRRAVEWQAESFQVGKLWQDDPKVPSLLTSPTLNILEHAFLNASYFERRRATVLSLAGRAGRERNGDWRRSALMAAAAAKIAMDTRDSASAALSIEPSELPAELETAGEQAAQRYESAWTTAEQTLHEILAMTPFAFAMTWPDDRPKRLLGLDFDGHDLLMRVSASADTDSSDSGDHRLYRWPLREPGQQAAWISEPTDRSLPQVGRHEIAAKGHPVLPEVFPPVSTGFGPKRATAQAGHDGAIRYLEPGRLVVPKELQPYSKPPTLLLGHRGIPTFLAFTPSRDGLVSVANLDHGSPEVRFWPFAEGGQAVGQPSVLKGTGRKPPETTDDLANLAFGQAAEGLRWTPGQPGHLQLGSSVLTISDGEAEGRFRVEQRDVDLSAHSDAEALPATTIDLSLPDPWATACSDDDRAPAGFPLPPIPTGLESLFREMPAHPPFSQTPQQRRSVREVLVDAQGRWLTALGHGSAALWSLPDFEQVWSTESAVSCLALGPRGHRLVVGGFDGSVEVYALYRDRRRGRVSPPVYLPGPKNEGFRVKSLAFDTTGRRLAVAQQAVFAPYPSKILHYRLDLDDLITLALGHAGDRDARRRLRAEILEQLPLVEPRLPKSARYRKKGAPSQQDLENRLSKSYIKLLGTPSRTKESGR